jgi:hypothetical protein
MAAFLNDRVLDNGLSALVSEVNKLTICSQMPTTYTEANATYALGNKTSPTVGSISDGSPNGRSVTVSSISDGSVTATGTATHYALLDTGNSRLLAANTLSSSQSVTNGNTFSLTAVTVNIPDPA